MQTEYEARFFDIDPDKITAQLESRGARQSMPRTLMRRIVFINDETDAKAAGCACANRASAPS